MIFKVDDLIRDFLAAQSPAVPCNVVFGSRAPTSQLNREQGARIVVELGDGEINIPVCVQKKPGRQLVSIDHTIQIRVWTRDPNATPTDDKAHFRKILDLFTLVVRALYSAQHGWLSWRTFKWTASDSPSFGRELVATAVVKMPIFDAAYTYVPGVSPIVTPGVLPGP
jgi:hypothetical protein